MAIGVCMHGKSTNIQYWVQTWHAVAIGCLHRLYRSSQAFVIAVLQASQQVTCLNLSFTKKININGNDFLSNLLQQLSLLSYKLCLF